jgi:hypothetical protein
VVALSRIELANRAHESRVARIQPTDRPRRLSKKSAQETTSGCCLSRALRWRSVMPPQTPNSTLLSSASAPHSCMTGQCRQITAALRCAAPRTKSSSGSVCRQRALETQAIRSTLSTRRSGLGRAVRLVLRVTGRVPDTSCPFPVAVRDRPPRVQICPETCATPCTAVLPASHRVYKLGGQVPIAQQSDNAFFGTLVPSGDNSGAGK